LQKLAETCTRLAGSLREAARNHQELARLAGLCRKLDKLLTFLQRICRQLAGGLQEISLQLPT
jgi:hypothetical protein